MTKRDADKQVEIVKHTEKKERERERERERETEKERNDYDPCA